MRVVVFGAGATGSLFGARLSAAGHQVTLVGRRGHVEAIRARGLRIEGLDGTFHVDAEVALEGNESPEAILLTVKGGDIERAATAIGTAFRTPVPVLLLQNGLGVEAPMAAGLRRAGWVEPERFLVRATHSIPATLVAPGVLRQPGNGEILLPRTEPSEADSVASSFGKLLRSAGFLVREVDNIRRELWRKTIVNAAINPVTADHGVLNGRISDDPWRGQALALLREARAAAQSEGFDFSEEELEQDLFRVVRNTAGNRSSMLQDLDRGRPTEIDWISGPILGAGRSHGLALPATERIVRRIHERVDAAAARSSTQSS